MIEKLTSQPVVRYSGHMMQIIKTTTFSVWLKGLSDHTARARILARIDRFVDGNLGDVKAVGNGIFEMRVHHGPGYRVYFLKRGSITVILLCGGDKSTQSADIAKAKKIARELEG